jgi:hypothetical protein
MLPSTLGKSDAKQLLAVSRMILAVSWCANHCVCPTPRPFDPSATALQQACRCARTQLEGFQPDQSGRIMAYQVVAFRLVEKFVGKIENH